MTFVIDNSVVCGWLLAAQATPYSESIAKRLLQGERAIAPALLPLEYSNVLRSACRKGRLTAELAQQALADLAQLPIQIDTTPIKRLGKIAISLRPRPLDDPGSRRADHRKPIPRKSQPMGCLGVPRQFQQQLRIRSIHHVAPCSIRQTGFDAVQRLQTGANRDQRTGRFCVQKIGVLIKQGHG